MPRTNAAQACLVIVCLPRFDSSSSLCTCQPTHVLLLLAAALLLLLVCTPPPPLPTHLQADMLSAARQRYESCLEKVTNWDDFMAALNNRHMVLAPWADEVAVSVTRSFKVCCVEE
jgi:hypothetical protein